MVQDNSPPPPLINRAIAPVRALFVGDASAGVLLILIAFAAMVVANSSLADAYHDLFHHAYFSADIFKLNTLHLWINDGLMAIFFFVIGLEVKRELVCGQLSTPEQRNLPVLAAAAGMAIPVLVYLFVSGGDPEITSGLAIPAATDIAFAMGVLGLLGSRVPASLRLFLLTVAIVDDIGAVMIIAVFYSEIGGSQLMWLIASIIVLGAMLGMNRAKVGNIWLYIAMAVVLWFCVLHSGIHATIAGVLAAFAIPMFRRDGQSLVERTEHALAPWSAYLIIPVFGFANAGVNLSDVGIDKVMDPLPLAIAAGLFLGKQVGIFSSVWIADKIGFAMRPVGASWPEIWGISILCGIGFTMSLFIGELAFPGNRLLIDEAKIGILLGSLISAIVGYTILRLTTKHPESETTSGSGLTAD